MYSVYMYSVYSVYRVYIVYIVGTVCIVCIVCTLNISAIANKGAIWVRNELHTFSVRVPETVLPLVCIGDKDLGFERRVRVHANLKAKFATMTMTYSLYRGYRGYGTGIGRYRGYRGYRGL